MTNHYRTNTDTTRFLLPLLGFTKEQVINENFVNAYLYTEDLAIFEDTIVLIYTKEQPKLKLIGIKRNGYHYYYATIDPKTYKRFVNGKYSQFEYSEKKTILDFWNQIKHSRLHSILFPEVHMQESFNFATKGLLIHKKNIWFSPDTIKETFIQSRYEDLISNGT